MKKTGFFSRRALSTALLAIAAGPALCLSTAAQSWPTKPVKIVVNFPPGGAADQIARAIGVPLGEALGQPVVVENRGGANGNLGGEMVAKSPADGYTLLMSSGGMVSVNPHIYARMPFDPAKDLVPVASAARVLVFLVAKPNFPANNIQEFLAHVKANPGINGVMLAGHGIICWADTAKSCYEHTVQLIADAAAYLRGERRFQTLFAPTATRSLAISSTPTSNPRYSWRRVTVTQFCAACSISNMASPARGKRHIGINSTTVSNRPTTSTTFCAFLPPALTSPCWRQPIQRVKANSSDHSSASKRKAPYWISRKELQIAARVSAAICQQTAPAILFRPPALNARPAIST